MAKIPLQGPKSASGDKHRRIALDGLYAELPRIACQGKCHTSCGPVPMSRVEFQRICRAAGDRKPISLTCPYLENERCSVYEVRPLLCRLWGVVEGMPCIYGCIPERMLTNEEATEFIARASEIAA